MAKRYKIQQRYDTYKNWERINPLLLVSEIGNVTDSAIGEYKVGDGKTHWNDLPMYKHWNGSGGGGGENPYRLPIATRSTLGGIKIGSGLSIDPETGIATVTGSGVQYELPIASDDILGGIKIGSGLIIDPDTGVVSVIDSGEIKYELPIASEGTLGGVKVGQGLTIDSDGVLSVVGGGSETPDGIYKSEITNTNLAMAEKVGGFKEGTKVNELSGKKTYSQMFDDLLFPTIKPTITPPKATLTLKSYTRIKEVGSTLPNIQLGTSSCNFIVGGSLGSITLSGVSINRSSGIDESKSQLSLANSDRYSKVPEGNSLVYTSKTWFKDGPIPLDNKGNKSGEAFKAGYDTATLTINGSYPVYYWKDRVDTNKVSPLLEWTSNNIEYTIPVDAYSGSNEPGNKYSTTLFKTPRPIKKILQYNTSSGKWEDITPSLPQINNPTSGNNWTSTSWDVERKAISINSGATKDYFIYKIKKTKGANTFKITF